MLSVKVLYQLTSINTQRLSVQLRYRRITIYMHCDLPHKNNNSALNSNRLSMAGYILEYGIRHLKFPNFCICDVKDIAFKYFFMTAKERLCVKSLKNGCYHRRGTTTEVFSTTTTTTATLTVPMTNVSRDRFRLGHVSGGFSKQNLYRVLVLGQ